MNKKPFYITTTLPYVNAEPHIGFAMEIIRADVIARWKRANGYDVFFNTGTDEHGIKIYQKAFDFGQSAQQYVDFSVKKFKELKTLLDLDRGIHFIRTTDPGHIKAAQEFWKRCQSNGYVYKKPYKARYCPGCELERTDTEIENGRCFIHQNIDLIIIEEENYFFRFSSFRDNLLELYDKNPDFVVPDFRFREIKAFVEKGLEDFSVSRLASKMPWGVPVPGDPDHVMYVWFDALVSYISTLGWPEDGGAFERFWRDGTPVQYCGKDNLRQQAAMWQAMLMSVGLPNSRRIIIDGFVTGVGGVKMSKTLGNTVNPVEVVKEYGADALRYYVLRELSPFEDSPFTPERFREAYNANLANGLGNLVSRILKLTSNHGITAPLPPKEKIRGDETARAFVESLDGFNIQRAADHIWARIASMDGEIQAVQPFKLLKSADAAEKERGRAVMAKLYGELWFVAVLLEPIMPEAASTIQGLVKDNKMPSSPLFARK